MKARNALAVLLYGNPLRDSVVWPGSLEDPEEANGELRRTGVYPLLFQKTWVEFSATTWLL